MTQRLLMTPRFFYGWVVLAAAFVIITMSIGTLFTLGVFLRPIEESMGWTRSGIGAIGLFNWIVMGAGGMVSGFTLLSALSLQAVLIFLYLFAGSEGALWTLSLAFGVAYGGAMPLYALVTREYFGERVLGTAYGGVFFISCIGMGLGSYAGGAIHDLLGTYQWLFLGSFAIRVMAIVLGVTLRVPVAVPVRRPSPAPGG